MSSPIFLVGAPRSGTTFLMHGVNTHPKVCITEETRVLNGVTQFINATNHQDFAFLHNESWRSYLDANMGGVIEGWYRDRLGVDTDQLHWGDKNPHYVDRRINPNTLEKIVTLWPDAQFVNIVRDGRDVVHSIADFGWLDVPASAALWADSVRYAKEFESAGGRMLTVRYDAVRSGETRLTQIHDWLGLSQHPDSDAWQEQQRLNPTPFRMAKTLHREHKSHLWQQADKILDEELRQWGFK